jgi:protein-tyrosine phosphatase
VTTPYVPFELATNLWRSRRPTAAEVATFKPPLFTVIDLEEGADEELAPVNFHIPMSSVFPPKLEDVQWASSLMHDEKRRPTLVHCHHGKTRSGICAAYWRVAFDGYSIDAAWKEMMELGFEKRYYLLGWPFFIRRLLRIAEQQRQP